MKVRFTPEALSELQSILDHISVLSPDGAHRVSTRIQAALSAISALPQSGVPSSILGMRRVHLRPYPYLIFYTVGERDVAIVGIRHAARDPSSMPDQGIGEPD